MELQQKFKPSEQILEYENNRKVTPKKYPFYTMTNMLDLFSGSLIHIAIELCGQSLAIFII